MTADEVVARVAALPAGLRFVGIDGFGGAGKTSLAVHVAAALPRTCVVHVDDFAGPDVAAWDWVRFGAEVLGPLQAGRPARYRVSRWDVGLTGAWRTVPAGALVVVEGVSATRSEAGVPWDLTVWVDAPADVRRARALARDGAAMWPVWEQQWIPSEQAWAARDRPRERADLVVYGATDRSLG